ncbi:MAG: hypothetical protein KDJ90_19220 [Nitratireductor sp.]|nr:hypothetical protein [Nitratireductor sp.]
MADQPYKLVSRSAFGAGEPLAESWPEFSIAELAGLSVWWLSVRAGGEDALSKACEKQFGAGLPQARRYAEGEKGVRIAWAGERQYFVTGMQDAVPGAIERAGRVVDQSDGWLAIRITGGKSREVMEKLCGIDLHASVFPGGSAARAPVEGMIALIVCEDDTNGTFMILFQRSSARSFLEHVRHAAHSTSPRG